MFGARAKVSFDKRRIARASREGNFKSLGHAAATIRLIARRSIKRARKARSRDEHGRFRSTGGTIPSPPGKPPRTKAGQLKRSIVYAVDKRRAEAVIGADSADMDKVAGAHEHGGKFKGQRYPKRPFMGPALEKVKPRLPKKWAGSVR